MKKLLNFINRIFIRASKIDEAKELGVEKPKKVRKRVKKEEPKKVVSKKPVTKKTAVKKTTVRKTSAKKK